MCIVWHFYIIVELYGGSQLLLMEKLDYQAKSSDLLKNRDKHDVSKQRSDTYV